MLPLLLLFVLLHPVHETVSEVEWNREMKRLEVGVRMHVLDEQWIRRQVDRETDVQDVALGYLKKHVRLNVEKDAVELTRDTYRWIGREEDGAHVWWYFEIEPVDHAEPKSLRQTMLFEHDADYVNRVVVLSRLPKLAQTLTIARPVMDLSLKATNDGKFDGGSNLDR